MNGKAGEHVRLFDASAKPRGEAFDAEGIPCATKHSLIALDRAASGGVVSVHPFDGTAAKLGLPSATDAILACGDVKAYALVDGDDGLTVRAIESEKATPIAPGDGDDPHPPTPRRSGHLRIVK